MPLALRDAQRTFAIALRDPARPVPEAVIGREGRPDERRFAVYRNNVYVSLVGALRRRFPVVHRLVGTSFFDAMARAYVAEHLPSTPVLIHYGDSFPGFIASFPPVASVPYMADVARLERAWSRAYHAKEAVSLARESINGCTADELGRSRLQLHPSLQLIESRYPVVSIWAAHQAPGEVVPPAVWSAERALVVRPAAEVEVHRLSQEAYLFVQQLVSGSRVEDAVAVTFGAFRHFDLSPHLLGLFDLGAVVATSCPAESDHG